MEEWLPPLQQGRTEVAWDAFLSRYRRLVFASIRHYTQDYDEGMDLFAHVCEKLRADGMARLRLRAETPGRARFSTWLVVVVRHLTVDWFRHRDGRRRLSALAQGLPPHRRRIFELVFVERRSHVEAYELLRAGETGELSFHAFLGDLREIYRTVTAGRRGRLVWELSLPPAAEESEPASPVELAERQERLQAALAELPPEDRVALELYLVQELPAQRVAAMLGLPNAKAVYNRVYRALAQAKAALARAGIREGDL
jgi:DNA-directed RNA polymerase specialized sigma24 family protein